MLKQNEFRVEIFPAGFLLLSKNAPGCVSREFTRYITRQICDLFRLCA